MGISRLAPLAPLCLMDRLQHRRQPQLRRQLQRHLQVVVQEVLWMHALTSAQAMSLPSVSSLARGDAKALLSDLRDQSFVVAFSYVARACLTASDALAMCLLFLAIKFQMI